MAVTHGNKLIQLVCDFSLFSLSLSLSQRAVGALMVDMFPAQRGHALILALCIQTQALAEVLSHITTMTIAKAAVSLLPMEDVKEMTTGSRPLKTA